MRPPRRSFLLDDSGQGLVEYAVILVLLSLALVTALNFMTGSASNTFDHAGTSSDTVRVH